jgi:tripeptide aminopeptidase
VSDVGALFVELARIPSPSGDERAVADRVTAYLTALGIPVEEDGAAGEIGGSAGNLIARLPGAEDGVPLVFCAHLDTVPVAGPLEPVVEDGVVRNGSGAAILGADDKAAVAVLLIAARRLVEDAVPHAGVELLFTPMEELACLGAKALDPGRIDARSGFVYDDARPIGAMIVRAPFGYRIDVAVRGRSAHAGIAPEDGRSAIQAAARAIARLEQGRVDAETTLNVGLVRGGVAPNVVAEHCSATVDVRSCDAAKARELVDAVVDTFEAAANDVGCRADVTVTEKYRGYDLPDDHPLVGLSRAALSSAGVTPVAVAGGGGSDANILNACGIACMNLANGMARIHTPEESIALADLERMVDVTLALIELAAVPAASVAGER